MDLAKQVFKVLGKQFLAVDSPELILEAVGEKVDSSGAVDMDGGLGKSFIVGVRDAAYRLPVAFDLDQLAVSEVDQRVAGSREFEGLQGGVIDDEADVHAVLILCAALF